MLRHTMNEGQNIPLPAIIRFYHLIARIWRKRRFARFEQRIRPRPDESLLDLGGYPMNWFGRAAVIGSVDVVNLGLVEAPHVPAGSPVIRSIDGDARNLALADGSYDIVFSNSVIEHVGDLGDQQAFAREARRLGRRLWIQTPAYECPIEPHYLGVFIHWFPAKWHAGLARLFSLRGLSGAADPAELREIASSTRLLTKREMRDLFPDCEIWTERLFFIIPKSHVAVRGVSSPNPD